MKKIAALLLTLLLVFSFAACQTTQTPASVSEETTVSEQTASVSSVSAPVSKAPVSKALSSAASKVPVSKSKAPAAVSKPTATSKVLANINQPPKKPASVSGNTGKAPAAITPDLWRVTGNGVKAPFYLFGSIHVGTKDLYPLPDYVMNAYASCNNLAVECLLDEAYSDDEMFEILKPVLYLDGSDITDHVTGWIYEEAKAFLEDNGLYEDYLDLYKPCVWSSFAGGLVTDGAGMSSDYGIDTVLINDARKSKKTILQVESLKAQYAVDGSFSEDYQEYELLSLTDPDYVKNGVASLKETYNAWKQGKMSALFSDEMWPQPDDMSDDLYAYYCAMESENEQKMLIDRNAGMAAKAKSYISAGKSVFLVVGAAHMYGRNGLVTRLQNAGYTVTKVKS